MPSKCGCVERINDQLTEMLDQQIEIATILGDSDVKGKIPIHATRYTDAGNPKKGKAIFAIYCPWCGEKWEWVDQKEEEPNPDS